MPLVKLNLSEGGKYIKRLSRVEFKNFNKKLKIDERDGSLNCDKFFRQDELFQKHTDVMDEGYRTYSINDIPAKDYNNPAQRDITHYETVQGGSYFEHGLPPYITIQKTKQKVYLDNINYDSPSFQRYQTMMEKDGLTLDDIGNVVHNSFLDGFFSIPLREDAFRFLHDGYPVEGVLNIMNMSHLKTSAGTKYYATGMMDFMTRFPQSRKHVVTWNTAKDEVFDKDGANLFTRLFDICGDEKLSGKILWDCREIDQNGLVKTNLRLGDIAEQILKGTGEWTESDRMFLDKIVERKKSREEYNKYEKSLVMFRTGINTKDILEVVYGIKPNTVQ